MLLVHDLAKFHWLMNRAIRLQQKAFANPDAIDTKYLELMTRYQNSNYRAFTNPMKTLQAAQRERVRLMKEFASLEPEGPLEIIYGDCYGNGTPYVPKTKEEEEAENPARTFQSPPGKLA